MATICTRELNGEVVRMGFYKDKDEYVVYIGHRMYGVADNAKDALKLFNEVK